MHNTVEFNSSQSKAILHGPGPMLVIAGPGSGKTLVISHRIKNLITKYGIRPEKILVITFTKAAAIEMQYRFCSLLDNQFGSCPVNFGTCHAIFFQIIRDATALNVNSIIKEHEKREIMEEILSCSSKNESFVLEPSMETIYKILSEISKVKNQQDNLDEYECSYCSKEEFKYIFEKYNSECNKRLKLDFDDMLSNCLYLLQNNKNLLRKYQSIFQYILIDEFQDINPVQYEIIKLLAGNEKNIFVVGDDDQSIYGFRGATPNIMKRFMEDYNDAVKIELSENYRSDKKIVEAATRLIKNNCFRFDKNPISTVDDRGDVRYFSFESREEEYDNIVSCIKQYINQTGTGYEDIAVLYRTNGHTNILISQLKKNGIPFNYKEKIVNIYETEIAKDIISYIRLSINKKDMKAFYRIMNRPVRYIKRKLVPAKPFELQEILKLQENDYVIHSIIQLYRSLDFISNMEPYPAINFIRKGIGYDRYLQEQAKELNRDLENDVNVINEITIDSKQFKTLAEWLSYVDGYESVLKEGLESKNGVNIRTMHGAKGLEWKLVIIPDVNEGTIPHKKARTDEEIEEERRVFYVAMTRAKLYLYMFFVKSKKADNICQPSRFLVECSDI